jgi:hypothetical protein
MTQTAESDVNARLRSFSCRLVKYHQLRMMALSHKTNDMETVTDDWLHTVFCRELADYLSWLRDMWGEDYETRDD